MAITVGRWEEMPSGKYSYWTWTWLERPHRNSWFTELKDYSMWLLPNLKIMWFLPNLKLIWFSIAMLVYQRVLGNHGFMAKLRGRHCFLEQKEFLEATSSSMTGRWCCRSDWELIQRTSWLHLSASNMAGFMAIDAIDVESVSKAESAVAE